MLFSKVSNPLFNFYNTLFSDSGQLTAERADLRASIPSTGSTLNWKTEHDSKYTPIVFTQDLRCTLQHYLSPHNIEHSLQMLMLNFYSGS